MKKLALVMVALLITFSHCFAQSRESIRIFVPPVTGVGSDAETLTYFTEMTLMEIPARGFSLGETQKLADYTIRGSVSPYDVQYDEPEELEEGMELTALPEGSYFALHVALLDNKTDIIMVEQDLIYSILEETNELFPVLIFNMLANIPLSKLSYDDTWRNKWIYFGAYINWSPRVYSGDASAAYLANFGLGLSSELHFLNYMSAEAGLEINQDAVASRAGTAARGLVVEVPILIKGVLKPSLHYMLESYAGFQLNGPTSREIMPPIISWLVGFQFGVKAGKTAIYIDARFIQDIGESMMNPDSTSERKNFQRTIIKINFGFKIGFVDRL